jgi:ADP-ribosylglycohydrolase
MEFTVLEQWINRTVWMDGCDVETEARQSREEGRAICELETDFKRLSAVPKPYESWYTPVGAGRNAQWLHEVQEIIDRVQSLPYRSDFPYVEPDDLEAIRAARPPSVLIGKWSCDEGLWFEKLSGGLLGRICGCMLGKPVEGWNRASIRAVAALAGNWPIADYLRKLTPEEDSRLDPKSRRFVCPDSWLKNGIDGMVEDDDTNYTTIGFAILEKYGRDFTPLDVAAYWCGNVPILHTCTAERVAYRNFVSHIVPPHSATHRNPYREWIGAQIRADYFGYANPGNPERAAEWAWRDACVSHVKNGIYGEMWVAAMLAAAYVESDWKTIILAGLAQIPVKCRLREDVEMVLGAYANGDSFEMTMDHIHDQWDETDHHDWCHTNSNAQVVAAALLYGEDSYEKTICLSIMHGFDTDCNAATCGSLWGVVHGASALPAKWTAPMNDTIRTGVHGYHEVAISKLAKDMLETAKANL